ncbi:nuclear transport factor 2 family protein [Micromonospora phytophila]|uniref:nuclear transport factor 2 family protein n=1 Tax=Micromonospora phytophila TaxID=709888 RepID=UPI0020301F00|nr:nuclear transport factor 2 family protein [Micromonospora phytophila]MCM0673556.1 nuclear transport factor 2 family protein [Micromonospora phytophila]
MTADALATEMANTERRRLRALVEVRLAEADALHAPDFELVHPSGGVWSKEQYLGGIASGDINYRRFEAVSSIDVMVDGDLAVLRYRSLIDIAVGGQEAGLLECWHVDCYRRDRDGGLWRVRWSQATSIDHA